MVLRVGAAVGLVRVGGSGCARRRVDLAVIGPRRAGRRRPVGVSGRDGELTTRRLSVRIVVLRVAVRCPGPSGTPDKWQQGDQHGSGDHKPGAHFPSVTVCLDTFHVPPERTSVAVTPSFSDGVTGLPVAL